MKKKLQAIIRRITTEAEMLPRYNCCRRNRLIMRHYRFLADRPVKEVTIRELKAIVSAAQFELSKMKHLTREVERGVVTDYMNDIYG